MTKEGGKAHAAYEVLLALGRELGEARLEVVALNHLAILTFHQQDTDPPRVRRLLEEARGVAEEGAALSRELAERPAPRTHLPSMLVGVMGLVASWRAGTNGIEIRCLNFLAYDTASSPRSKLLSLSVLLLLAALRALVFCGRGVTACGAPCAGLLVRPRSGPPPFPSPLGSPPFSFTFDLLRRQLGGRGESVVRSSMPWVARHIEKSVIMPVGYLEVPRARS
jgi:hypothetical protein